MPIIETRNLCKRYGTVMRVTNLALQVPEGSIYGFLGPNGAGKSTTLKMILGLVRPTQGEIQVFGQPMNRGNRIAVLRQVGSLIEDVYKRQRPGWPPGGAWGLPRQRP